MVRNVLAAVVGAGARARRPVDAVAAGVDGEQHRPVAERLAHAGGGLHRRRRVAVVLQDQDVARARVGDLDRRLDRGGRPERAGPQVRRETGAQRVGLAVVGHVARVLGDVGGPADVAARDGVGGGDRVVRRHARGGGRGRGQRVQDRAQQFGLLGGGRAVGEVGGGPPRLDEVGQRRVLVEQVERGEPQHVAGHGDGRAGDRHRCRVQALGQREVGPGDLLGRRAEARARCPRRTARRRGIGPPCRRSACGTPRTRRASGRRRCPARPGRWPPGTASRRRLRGSCRRSRPSRRSAARRAPAGSGPCPARWRRW